MKKILVTYWPQGGNVETCAHKVKSALGGDSVLKPLENITNDDLQQADVIVAGCSTVGAETWRETMGNNQWNKFFANLDKKLIFNKKVAIFGLGDQVSYADHFVDFMAQLKEEFQKSGAHIIGKWPVKGYNFKESEAVEGGYFVGLALDEDWQTEFTDTRIKEWVNQILSEI